MVLQDSMEVGHYIDMLFGKNFFRSFRLVGSSLVFNVGVLFPSSSVLLFSKELSEKPLSICASLQGGSRGRWGGGVQRERKVSEKGKKRQKKKTHSGLLLLAGKRDERIPLILGNFSSSSFSSSPLSSPPSASDEADRRLSLSLFPIFAEGGRKNVSGSVCRRRFGAK